MEPPCNSYWDRNSSINNKNNEHQHQLRCHHYRRRHLGRQL